MLRRKLFAAVIASTAVAAPLAAQDSPAVIAVTANDYAFVAPDTVPAGLVTFEMTNEGKEPHHITVARLDDGKTMADVATLMGSHGPPPAWFVTVGGPQATQGAPANATLLLTPGNYVYICFIPSPDGVPHIAKGMIRPFTVAGEAATRTASVPNDAIRVRLVDYGFELSAPLTAGRHTLVFENPATQPHELVLMKLAPGRTAAEAAAWVERMEGPPPMSLAGGVTSLDPGVQATTTVDLEPGEYALICFIPDDKDGKPHVAHGMISQITVE